MNQAVYRARECMAQGEDFVAAQVVESAGSTPRKTGAWLMMTAAGERFGTVGGGKLEAEVERLCRETFETHEDRTVDFTLDAQAQSGLDMRCGGDVSVALSYLTPDKARAFLSELRADARAYIFGGGHVGLALERALRAIDFETVMLDDREEYANKERFPHSEVHVLEDYQRAFDGLKTDGRSFIVIVTRGHAGDYDVLRQALRVPNAYIGMIGSRKKVAAAMASLREEGFDEAALAAVHSPIGLKIGAETPEEIAVSVAAEMIAVRAGVAL